MTKESVMVKSGTSSLFKAWPHYGDDEVAAVTRAMTSGKVNYWTGSEGKEFESEFAKATGTAHAVALMNGTVALEAALYALGIGDGDEVVVPCRTFIASASCVVMRGGRPVPAEVDRESQNITVDTIRAAVTPKTKGIIAVHLAGWPCEMDEILAFAKERGLAVIEDCAQAHGAQYKGRPVGSLADVSAWSFCQDKIISTGGEGGMITTNDPALYAKIWSYKDHGKSMKAMSSSPDKPNSFKLVHDSFGTNLRMTELQAGIGRLQLKKLPAWQDTRSHYAAIMNARFASLPLLRVPVLPRHIRHAFYKYYVFLRPELLKTGWSRERILAEINAAGVPCMTGSSPEIYLEKAFQTRGWAPSSRFPVARELGETSLMFLIHPTLTEEAINYTCDVTEKVVGEATAGKHQQ